MNGKGHALQVGVTMGVALLSAMGLYVSVIGQGTPQSLDGGTVVLGFMLAIAAVALGALLSYRSVAQALDDLHQQQKELERLRAEFVQNVTHELRQPLTLVRGYIETLARERLDEEMHRELLNRALARTIELMERVEAITTFESLPRHSPQPSDVDLVELVETALKMVWQEAYRAGITFYLEDPPHPIRLKADPVWLLQALKQLLDNAIKFSPEGATVSIRLAVTEEEAEVRIADQGIGIPVTQLDRVFTPFCQLDGSPSRRYGGMGLGLAIARQIAEAHGGSLRAEPGGSGRGSTFVLSLPLHGGRREGAWDGSSPRVQSLVTYV